MSYLRFEKTLMTNLEESLQKEILRTNRSGAYHCSTIVDCNTRKYHGLLVVPVPELDEENHVLLSSLDETVVLHGAEFNLGLHKYNGDNFSPRGNKYIREFTPGPPGEIIPIFNEEVRPYLEGRRGEVIVSKNIHIFGMGESAVEEKLKDLMTRSENPTVAPYCKEGEVRLRVTSKSNSKENCIAMCDQMIEQIKSTEVGKFIYGVDVDSLENAVVLFLRERGLTLATAESCTGGFMAKRITDIAGCSDVFLGGCVTYANEAKERLLGVKHETLEQYGAVSEQTAMEMAKGIREALGADIGVSATGIAGPGGGSEEKPVGTVYIGISTKNGENFRKLSLSSMRSRDYIRKVSVANAYDLVLKSE